LLKKYRFAKDVYTDQQLEDLTLGNYFETQKSIATQPRRTEMSYRVLQEARSIAGSILGEFLEVDVINKAKFGKKSSIGCPLTLAHIDHKLTNVRAFSGSSTTADWFREHFASKDAVLQCCLADVQTGRHNANLAIEFLDLKNVPKSWKTLRTITPLTLLGLFYSHGIGGVVTERLKIAGLDIRHLQTRHRKLVKVFSKTGSHATADLSSASDTLVSWLLNMVLPRKWYVALKKAMTHNLRYEQNGVEMKAYTESVLPMGNGATFPVETLVFYSIIKAIGNLSKINGIYSVYGDDLIYPSTVHKFVKAIFPSLGFKLNEEKTNASGFFRESCGADYFHGVDVRPFSFPGEHQNLTRSQYLSFLYKVYNGLSLRWHECEIRGTLFYLLREIASLGYLVHRIPPSYPATAGIQVRNPGVIPLGLDGSLFSPILSFFGKGTVNHEFVYLAERAKKRFVLFTEPYYWLALQRRHDMVEKPPHEISLRNHAHSMGDTDIRPLRWEKSHRYRSYNRGKKKIRKTIVCYKPYVAEKQFTTTHEVLGAVTDWI